MRSSDINANLVDCYYALLKNLSPNNKLELIAQLTKSIKKIKKIKDNSWKSLFGALVLEEPAEKFVDQMKKDRQFSRKSVDL